MLTCNPADALLQTLEAATAGSTRLYPPGTIGDMPLEAVSRCAPPGSRLSSRFIRAATRVHRSTGETE